MPVQGRIVIQKVSIGVSSDKIGDVSDFCLYYLPGGVVDERLRPISLVLTRSAGGTDCEKVLANLLAQSYLEDNRAAATVRTQP
jgi:hypothetical protein